MFDGFYRKSMLGVAGFTPVERLVKRIGLNAVAGRFVAGETLDAAIVTLQRLRADGFHTVLDLLGEFVDTRAGVDSMVAQISATLERVGREDVGKYISVKPTQLGLGVGAELALENAGRLSEQAAPSGIHICLDMENHPYCQQTLDLYAALRLRGHDHVSTVLQSYLHRSVEDLTRLVSEYPSGEIRLVKGAYRESPSVAYQDAATIHEKYLELLDIALAAGLRVNLATHDEKLIEACLERLTANGVRSDQYEFQLLYGIKPRLQARLRDAAHQVRIYVPYGVDWYGYYSRRLAERPANLFLVLKGLVG